MLEYNWQVGEKAIMSIEHNWRKTIENIVNVDKVGKIHVWLSNKSGQQFRFNVNGREVGAHERGVSRRTARPATQEDIDRIQREKRHAVLNASVRNAIEELTKEGCQKPLSTQQLESILRIINE